HSPVLNGNRPTQAATSAAWSNRVIPGGMIGRLWKAMTKVSRYSASGMTQRNGAEATSVARWAVTPSIRLDGAAASSTQTSFWRHGIGAVGASAAGSGAAALRRRQITQASTAIITANRP